LISQVVQQKESYRTFQLFFSVNIFQDLYQIFSRQPSAVTSPLNFKTHDKK